jgi:cyclic pyranopterin phosphate synthase
MDLFGRRVDYLRISVTDRCNERCLYCMPDGYRGWERKPDHLSVEEIVRVVRVAAGMGVRYFRLTGGEPLVRADTLEMVRSLAVVPGVACLGLSTNGRRLAARAQALRRAGLRTVNISLDALDPQVYRRITGAALEPVLDGIRAAVAAGFERVKLNCGLMRGVNESEIWPLVLFAAEHGLPLRLIELMPVTSTEVLTERNFLPLGQALELLRQRDELVPQPEPHLGWGPAEYYRLKHTGAWVGFIGAMTRPRFCDACNKMRLTADGKVRPCLGDHAEVDLRSALRSASGDEAVRERLRQALQGKPRRHAFENHYQPGRPMTAIGG